MTVREFRDYLSTLPDDMQIVETRYSDLRPMELDSWGTLQGIERVSGRLGWVQRADLLTDANRALVKPYLHYCGN